MYSHEGNTIWDSWYLVEGGEAHMFYLTHGPVFVHPSMNIQVRRY